MAVKRKRIRFLLWGVVILLLGVKGTPLPAMDSESGPPQLDLTSEQERILKDLKMQFRQEESVIQKKIMSKRRELMTLPAEDSRGEKGEGLRRQIQALMLQAREKALNYQQEALSVLNTEQKKMLPPESDMGFRCRGWFRYGQGPGMGMGRGGPRFGPVQPKTE